MQKYTKMPADAFTHLQLNAGILVDTFTPETGEIGNILGATSGGVNFNCPANTKQLKHLEQYDASMAGTFLTCSASGIAGLLAAADVDANDTTHVVPRGELLEKDFTELWWIGDYSDKNTGSNAGFLAIRLKNALNTTGFQIQSGKNAKGTMSFEYHAHYDITNMDEVPFDIYCKEGAA